MDEHTISEPATVGESTPVSLDPRAKSKNLLPILIGFIILFLGFGLGYMMNGTKVPQAPISYQSPTESPDSPSPTRYVAPDETAAWKIQRLQTLGLEFKLPPKISALGELREEIIPGDTGTQICGQFGRGTTFLPKVFAGGGCSTERNPYLALGTTSVGFSAGRDGGFTDLQGFTYRNGDYLARFSLEGTGERFIDSIPQERITPVENTYGVEIIKIDGLEIPDEGPTLMNSLGDNTGVIINTKNPTYPGLVIIFYTPEGISENEVDQILATVKFVTN